jgi:acyl-CoA reductase-like NAD-dependent aldehyde dehydrogenase
VFGENAIAIVKQVFVSLFEPNGLTQLLHEGFSFAIRRISSVCVRILAYNQPLMFAAGKLAAPLVTGNNVILKPPPQAPLSVIRMCRTWTSVKCEVRWPRPLLLWVGGWVNST